MSQADREAAIRRGEIQASEVIPGEAPPRTGFGERKAVEGSSRQVLRPGPRTGPFESRDPSAAGVAAREAKDPLVMPTEENLGLPTQMVRDASPEMRDRLVRIAQDNYRAIQEQRRGVLTVDQMRAWGAELGVDVHVLDLIKPGSAITPEGVAALKGALDEVAKEGLRLEDEIRIAGPNASSEMKARLAVNLYENFAVQKALAGGRAEWGRVGVMLREVSGGGGRREDFYQRILKAVGGEKNVDKVSALIRDIRTDPTILDEVERNARTLAVVRGLGKADNWEKLDEAMMNGLISNTRSHPGYVMGQMVAHLLSDAVVFGRVAAGGVRTAGGRRGESGLSFVGAVGRYIGEKDGLADGIKAAGLTFRTGISRQSLRTFEGSGFQPRARALEGSAGAVLTFPSKVVETYTSFFHEWTRTGRLYELVYDQLAKEGALKPFSKDFFTEAQRRINNPTREMEQIATRAGNAAALRGSPNSRFVDWIKTARDFQVQDIVPATSRIGIGGFRPGRGIEPFINITFNVAREGVEWSPLGTLVAVGKRGQAADESLAKAAVGWGLWAYFWDQGEQGNLTGALPSDPNDRAQFLREGKRPYSIKMNGAWQDYSKLEPIAFSLRWVSGFRDLWHDYQRNSEGKSLDAALLATAAWKAVQVMGEGFANGNWSIGINQIANAWKYKDPGSLVGQQIAERIPFSSLLRTSAQSSDPYVRQPRGVLQQVEAVIPGLSALVPAQRDIYGESVRRPTSEQGVSGMVNPFRGSPETLDPVDQELSRHASKAIVDAQGNPIPPRQFFVTKAAEEIGSFKLSKEEGFTFQTLWGRSAHQHLASLFDGATDYKGKPYKLMSDAEKVTAIQGAIRDARATARAVVADAIMLKAATAPEVARAADMRLSLISPRHDRALYLEGLQRLGKLTPQVSALINEKLNPAGKPRTSPTVAEYLRAAPLVSEYLHAPAFDRGDPKEWAQLKDDRAAYDQIVRRDKLDGTTNAIAYLRTHPLVSQYHGVSRSRARQRILDRNPWLAPYVEATTYTYEGN